MGASWLLEFESVHQLLYSFDRNQVAFAVPVTVSSLTVSGCFRYHEIDHLVSLFYVSGTIDAFNGIIFEFLPRVSQMG